MADDSAQNKTEEPTPKRKKEARERGQVPRSREVNTAVLLLGGAMVLQFAGAPMARAVESLFRGTVSTLTAVPVGARETAAWLQGLVRFVLVLLAPPVLVLGGLALGSAGLQAQGVLSAKPLVPKWSRLNPVSNAKRIWGVKALAELGKSLLKLAVVAVVVYFAGTRLVPEMPGLARKPPPALLEFVHRASVRLLGYAGGAYLLLAMADYAFQTWRHHRQLRMTRREVKDEKKETEGDPMVKMRRRSMARSLARRRMILSVSEADVVVTNPTHLAVALRYDPMEANAPVVLAMGARKMAHRIRKMAKDAGVTVVENKPLARALFRTAEVGEPIPVELYVAVAEVLAFVYRRRREGSGS